MLGVAATYLRKVSRALFETVTETYTWQITRLAETHCQSLMRDYRFFLLAVWLAALCTAREKKGPLQGQIAPYVPQQHQEQIVGGHWSRII